MAQHIHSAQKERRPLAHSPGLVPANRKLGGHAHSAPAPALPMGNVELVGPWEPETGLLTPALNPWAPFNASWVHLMRTGSKGSPPTSALKPLLMPTWVRLPPRPHRGTDVTRKTADETGDRDRRRGPLRKSLTATCSSGRHGAGECRARHVGEVTA